ncbi:MAG: response regulator, partial [Myxococcaceae bacterium]|nr:response regulator [Myxococcaceae bacterium]
MDQRRILIVDHDEKFALSLATGLHKAGLQTALAHNVSDAQQEIENRNPRMVILRAELPQQSGFSLTGVWKKRYPTLPILLISEANKEALDAHRNSPNAAHGYLQMPFKPAALVSVVKEMIAALDQLQQHSGGDDVSSALDRLDKPSSAPGMPPPLKPPPVPKRERRSAITEDDRTFLSRTFASIAERKAELLADAATHKKPTFSRKDLATPEGKLQVLREELRQRESQIARLSEIWTTRDREQIALDDRLHEKEIEVETCKRQIEDMMQRFAEAQQAYLKREELHGATIDELILQKFSQEKDLIEVVAGKEKELNLLKKELQHREDDIDARDAELEQAARDAEALRSSAEQAAYESSQREWALYQLLAMRETEIEGHLEDLETVCERLEAVKGERDARVDQAARERRELTATFDREISLREHALRELSERLAERESAIGFLRSEIDVRMGEAREKYAELEEELLQAEEALGSLDDECQKVRNQRDGHFQSLTMRLSERDDWIERLNAELDAERQRAHDQEEDLTARIAAHLDRISELEGELEALQAHSAGVESELSATIKSLNADLEGTREALAKAEQDLVTAAERYQSLLDAKDALEGELRGEIADRDGRIADCEGQIAALQGDLEATIEARDALENELRGEIVDRDDRVTVLEGDLASLGLAKDALEGELRGEIADRDGRIADCEGQIAALQGDL